ncbi:putative NAD(P)H dehydrogenase (quinone) FQR1-like [Arachis hypogaea]|nr:putative NAD(P)H dehydrogenase (quinone) FQR1-like [Arachis hypogaea]
MMGESSNAVGLMPGYSDAEQENEDIEVKKFAVYGPSGAQMKPFFASIGQLWKEQKLAEKPARFVISTGTQAMLSSAASSTADLLAKGKKSRPRWKKNGPSADKKTTCKCKAKRMMDIGGAYAVSRSHSAIWKNCRAWNVAFARRALKDSDLRIAHNSGILRKKVKRWEVKVLELSSEMERKLSSSSRRFLVKVTKLKPADLPLTAVSISLMLEQSFGERELSQQVPLMVVSDPASWSESGLIVERNSRAKEAKSF